MNQERGLQLSKKGFQENIYTKFFIMQKMFSVMNEYGYFC